MAEETDTTKRHIIHEEQIPYTNAMLVVSMQNLEPGTATASVVGPVASIQTQSGKLIPIATASPIGTTVTLTFLPDQHRYISHQHMPNTVATDQKLGLYGIRYQHMRVKEKDEGQQTVHVSPINGGIDPEVIYTALHENQADPALVEFLLLQELFSLLEPVTQLSMLGIVHGDVTTRSTGNARNILHMLHLNALSLIDYGRSLDMLRGRDLTTSENEINLKQNYAYVFQMQAYIKSLTLAATRFGQPLPHFDQIIGHIRSILQEPENIIRKNEAISDLLRQELISIARTILPSDIPKTRTIAAANTMTSDIVTESVLRYLLRKAGCIEGVDYTAQDIPHMRKALLSYLASVQEQEPVLHTDRNLTAGLAAANKDVKKARERGKTPLVIPIITGNKSNQLLLQAPDGTLEVMYYEIAENENPLQTIYRNLCAIFGEAEVLKHFQYLGYQQYYDWKESLTQVADAEELNFRIYMQEIETTLPNGYKTVWLPLHEIEAYVQAHPERSELISFAQRTMFV